MESDIDYLIAHIAASCAPPVTHVPKESGISELLINVLGGERDGSTRSESIR
jgi:hypothetical protein